MCTFALMKRLVICTRREGIVLPEEGVLVLAVEELNVGKCRGCMRCKILKQCITYNDDAQRCIPIVTEADHLDVYLQPEGNVKLLMDRTLYALNGKGKTFTFHGEEGAESQYLRRLLTWAGYAEQSQDMQG